MKQYWSLTEGVFNCLLDRRRTLAFRRAIKNTVKPNDVVVDLGSGSGILSLFAAQAGARKVYAVEHDPKNAQWLDRVFSANGFGGIIQTIVGDATLVDLPEKADVVICEMIATGLIEELQLQAMNNALRFMKNDTRVVLNSMENYVEAVCVRDRFYGFHLPVPQYEYPEENLVDAQALTPRHLYKTVHFSEPNKPEIDVVAELPIKKIQRATKINGIRISNRTIFCDGSSFGASFAYCYPVVMPVPPVKVKPGDTVQIRLNYRMCEGFSSFRYDVVKK